jgi:hypothetical protein
MRWSVPSFFITLFLFHLFIVYRCAVNIPYLDDWGMFQGGPPAVLSAGWLLAFVNDHIIATTKLFVWLQYHLNGWNYSVALLLSFLIYGLFLASIVRFACRAAPHVPSWVIWAFMLFFLSPINWFNHFMATQTCYHFSVLFFFVGSYYLFSARQRWSHLFVGCAMSILSILSLSSGIAWCAVLLIAFVVYKRMCAPSRMGTGEGARVLLQLLGAVAFIGGALLIWVVSYVKQTQPPSLMLPNTLRFWMVFLNLVSHGFGIEGLSPAWGAVCLLIVVVPICAVIWKQKGKLANTQWVSLVLVMGILAGAAQIAIGRGGVGVEAVSKADRYVELVMPLIPLSVISWADLLQGHRRLLTGVLSGLFVFCLVAFSNNWAFDVYRAEAANRTEGRRCVKAYYQDVGDAQCPTIYPAFLRIPLATRLEWARKLNASFYRDISEEIEQERQTKSGGARLSNISTLGVHNEELTISEAPGKRQSISIQP